MSNTSNGGRVTTREFYDALLDQNKSRADMEVRILDRLDDITSNQAAAEERFNAIDDKVDAGCLRLDKRIDATNKTVEKVRNLNITITALFSAIASIIGLQR